MILILERYSSEAMLAFYVRVGVFEAWAEYDRKRGGLGFSVERNARGEATLYAGRLMVQWNWGVRRARPEDERDDGQPTEQETHPARHRSNPSWAPPWHQQSASHAEPPRSWLHQLRFPRGLRPSLRAMRPKTHTA